MYRIRAVLFFGCFSVIAMGCNCAQKVASSDYATEPSTITSHEITIDKAFEQNKETTAKLGNPVRIDSIAVQQGLLKLTVSYSGGCKPHSFELISNLQYLKSNPPKTTLFLKHHDGDDACRKRIQETIYFALSSIQYTGYKTIDFQLFNDKRWNTYNYD